jgi:hypothetical protein
MDSPPILPGAVSSHVLPEGRAACQWKALLRMVPTVPARVRRVGDALLSFDVSPRSEKER